MNLLKTILIFCFTILLSVSCSTLVDQDVVISPQELNCQIEAKGELGMKMVEIKHDNFNGPQPMIEKGHITGFRINNNMIELLDGKIENGFLKTKEYGEVRIIGIGNPVFLWVKKSQKDKLLKLDKK